jgi:hypothetical protein
MLDLMLSGDELRSLRLAVSRSPLQPPIPAAHERKLRYLGLVREAPGGLGPTDKGWMALARR